MPKMTLEKKNEILLDLCKHADTCENDAEYIKAQIKERLSYIPHKKLYKFRTCTKDNFDILENNCIWMAPASEFPDPFDNTINIDVIKNKKELSNWFFNEFPTLLNDMFLMPLKEQGFNLQARDINMAEYVKECVDVEGNIDAEKEKEYIRKIATPEELEQIDNIFKLVAITREKISKNEENLINGFIRTINEMRESARNSMLIYCMTEKYDNSVCWENYADRYTGFCIEYDFSKYNKIGIEFIKNVIYLLPITYLKEKPNIDLSKILDGSLKERIYGDTTWKENPELNREICSQIYYKNKEYSFEHEWRFFGKRNGNNNKQFFPFVSALYAGKDIKSKDLQHLIRIAEKLNVPVYKQEFNKTKNGYIYTCIKEKTA